MLSLPQNRLHSRASTKRFLPSAFCTDVDKFDVCSKLVRDLVSCRMSRKPHHGIEWCMCIGKCHS